MISDWNIIFSLGFGIVLNFALLVCCCTKQCWRFPGNVKYFAMTQGLLGIIAVSGYFLIHIAKMTHTEGLLCSCQFLPAAIEFSLSLAIFTFAGFLVLRGRELASGMAMRRTWVALCLVCSASSAVALFLPAFIAGNTPILVYIACYGEQLSYLHNYGAKFAVDVSIYASWVIVFQFVLPANLIFNRLILLTCNYMNEPTTEDKAVQPSRNHKVWLNFAINGVHVVFTGILSLLILSRYSTDDATEKLNIILAKFENVFLFQLCSFVPIYFFSFILCNYRQKAGTINM